MPERTPLGGAGESRPQDKELELYRTLMEEPTEFQEGFGLITVLGALFCGFLMVPGAIYLSLLAGQSMGPAATWVTVILFMEVARRSLASMRKSQVVILLSVAGMIVGGMSAAVSGGGYLGDLIWRAFLANSPAAQDAGLTHLFPRWAVPPPDSPALASRTFLHYDWLIPVVLMTGLALIGALNSYCMGYLFFRLTSDVERLPFPMAPVVASGTLALVEVEGKEQGWRWTVFATGAMLGVGFGAINVLVPVLTSSVFGAPLTLIPLPWLELTPLTQKALPAVAFGVTFELGILLTGMVMPFWAVAGTAAAILLTMLLNPVLYHFRVLHTWQQGMGTIDTMYVNSIDFWFSAGLGVTFGLAFVSIFQTVVSVTRTLRERRQQAGSRTKGSLTDTPPGRGDFSLKIALSIYIVCSLLIIAVCWVLLPKFRSFVWVLLLLVFLYNPLISYVNARIVGIAGQQVDIPFVREGLFILSGYRGLDIWFAPIPVANYGAAAQSFRALELTGTSFWSLVKAQAVALPLVLLVSFIFWSYLWHLSPIPSDLFPFAQKMWELNARNSVLMYTATTGVPGMETMFQKAFNPHLLAVGGVFCVLAFLMLSWLRLPTMMVYGFVAGVGQLPHGFVLQFVGALLGRFYLRKRFGEKQFLQYAPVLLAGYFTGTGLIGMLGIAVALIASAVKKGVF